jgi:hypothetical protein
VSLHRASFTALAITAAIGGMSLAAAASTVIISPVAATATSEFASAFGIVNAINPSGLTVRFESGVTDFDTYFSLNPLHSRGAPTEWFSAEGVTSPRIVYDLWNVFCGLRLALWNEDFAGFGSAEMANSVDGESFTALGSLSGTDHTGIG